MPKVFDVVLVGVLLALVGCNSEKTTAAQETSVTATPWSSNGINMAAFLFTDDFNNLVAGGDSYLKKTDLASIAHVDIVTTANEYEADFDANEIAADQKYHSKKILLYGTVQSINKDVFGGGYFTLASSNFSGVQAHLRDEALEKAAIEKKGDSVVLACDPGMRIMSFATVNKCLYLSQYMQQGHVSPDEQVRAFFSGKTAIPIDGFRGVLLGYALGVSPSTPSVCVHNPSRNNCAKLTKAESQPAGDWMKKLDMKRSFKFVSCKEPSHEIPKDDPTNAVCVFAKAAPQNP